MITNIELMRISSKKPETATHYSLLSEQYLRKVKGGFERYDPLLRRKWTASKIKDEKLAKVVELI